MISLKEYIITLMSVFLALGIGIIVGTSFTESVVVEQQKSIIEELEARYLDYLDEKEDMKSENKKMADLLALWDEVAMQMAIHDDNKELKGLEVGIISLDHKRGLEVHDFLLERELIVNPYIYRTEEGSLAKESIVKMFELSKSLLENSHIPPLREGSSEKSIISCEYKFPVNPGTLLVVGGGIPLERTQTALIKEGLQGMKDIKVIALEDYFVEEGFLTHLGDKISGIDYIDTTAGKMALLKLLQGKEGPFILKRPSR